MNLGHGKYSDVHGSRDRGSRKFKRHVHKKEGDVMVIAEKNVVSTHSGNSILNVAKLMQGNDFRRIPVTNAGSGRLEGMAKSIDIIDFLGGGEKYNIIVKDYNGNFLSAINCPISKIMSPAIYLTKKSSVENVVAVMLAKQTSSIPIVEDEESLKATAIVTERDVLPNVAEFGVKVSEVMREDCITATPGMILSDVSKIMVRNKIRRLPVLREDEVVGVVTQFDILGFIGKGEFKGVTDEENLSVPVSEIMSSKVISVSPSQDLADVVSLVDETGLGGFPVLEGKILRGIVTTMDVIRHIYSN